MTDLIIVFLFLIVEIQLEAFLTNSGLDVAASSMTFLRLLFLTILAFLPRLVRVANHLRFAMTPDDSHPRLRVTDMSYLVRKVRVRLTNTKSNNMRWEDEEEISRYANQRVSKCVYDGYTAWSEQDSTRAISTKCIGTRHTSASQSGADHLPTSQCSQDDMQPLVSCTPRSAPHFTTQPRVQPTRVGAIGGTAVKRPKTRTNHTTSGRTPWVTRD